MIAVEEVAGFQLRELLTVLTIPAGLAGLPLQRFHVPLHFIDDVAQADKIGLDSIEFVECGLLLGLVFTDAGGLFEDNSAFLRVGLKQDVYLALFDHRIGVVADSGAHEELLQITEPALGFVQEVLALSSPIKAARYPDLVVIDVQDVLGIREDERCFGIAVRLAMGRSAEDDIRHS